MMTLVVLVLGFEIPMKILVKNNITRLQVGIIKSPNPLRKVTEHDPKWIIGKQTSLDLSF